MILGHRGPVDILDDFDPRLWFLLGHAAAAPGGAVRGGALGYHPGIVSTMSESRGPVFTSRMRGAAVPRAHAFCTE